MSEEEISENNLRKYINEANFIESFEQLKKNKIVINSIDKDFFFEYVGLILDRYKEIQKNNEKLKQMLNDSIEGGVD